MPFNRRGSIAPLLFAMGIGAVVALLGVAALREQNQVSKRAVSTRNEIGGFYASEALAWHALSLGGGPAGSATTRFPASFVNDYLGSLPPNMPHDTYSPSGYIDGTPLNVWGTRGLDESRALASRLVPGATFVDRPDTSAAAPRFCGVTDYPGTQPVVKACLVALTSSSVVTPLTPTADIKANGTDTDYQIAGPGTVNLTWTSTNADSCEVTPPGGPGWQGLSGAGVTANISQPTTFTVTCTSASSSVQDSVTVRIAPLPPLNSDPLLYCLNVVADTACPNDYAVVGWTDPAGSGPAAFGPRISNLSYCCRMPANFFTAAPPTKHPTDCPAGQVAVGGTVEPSGVKNILCRTVNAANYQLSPEIKGTWWTAPGCKCFSGRGSAAQMSRFSLPPAIRFAAGRAKVTDLGGNDYEAAFDESACIPRAPIFNAVMTKKRSKYCGDMYGRRIQDAVSGADIPIFPACVVSAPITGVWQMYGAWRGWKETYTDLVCP